MVQILSPIAITIAYFSLPQTVVPFQLNSKSFTVSIFIIIAVVRLLFVVLCALPRRPLWWIKTTAWLKRRQSDAVAYGRFMPRRGKITKGPDHTPDGLELKSLEV
jgi:hypothetical protein